MPLTTKLNLSDIPVEKVKGLNGLAILGELQTKTSSNGEYELISLPLYYRSTKDLNDNFVAPSTYKDMEDLGEIASFEEAKELGLGTFTARWNIKEDWLDQKFLEQIRQKTVDEKEAAMFGINFTGITRSLFRALGSTEVDFSLNTVGKIIGFKASSGKNEPDKNQIRSFYYARRS